MSVTAAQVKELRERTGAGMMECKKALVETNGDMDTAIENLRKSGLAKADKKSGRIAAEGTIVHAQEDGHSVMVEVNCETDFVAKDANFVDFAQSVVANAIHAEDIDALLASKLPSGESIEDKRQQLVAKIGENVQVRRMSHLRVEGAIMGCYIHGGRIGVMVAIRGGDEDLAKDLAMHVAALNPAYINEQEVPGDFLEKEKEILIAQAADSGKPADIIEKMVGGRLKKRLAEITLVGQPFVKDGDVTVEQLLKNKGAEVLAFSRLEVGEGIEKAEEDFAAEVMAQVKGG